MDNTSVPAWLWPHLLDFVLEDSVQLLQADGAEVIAAEGAQCTCRCSVVLW